METVTIRSSEGAEFAMDVVTARGCKLFREVLETSGETSGASKEAIEVAAVAAKQMALVVRYLENHKVQPLKSITRPLPSGNMEEAGVPAWAVALVREVQGLELLDLADAAVFLKMNMYVVSLRRRAGFGSTHKCQIGGERVSVKLEVEAVTFVCPLPLCIV
jgi:hypothetical protein